MQKRIMTGLAAFLAAALILVGFATPAHAANETYTYAGAGQTIATTKLAANMSVENQYTDIWDNHHSLKELSVLRGNGAAWQVVEVGINVDDALYGDQDTHVFTSAFVDGNWLGYNTLGAGGGSSGFVPCSGIVTPCTTIGSSLITGPGGSPLSGVKPFVIEYMTVSGTYTGWWVSYNSTYLGYWPASLWSSASGGAFVQGDRVDLFGEVQAWTWTSPGPCDDMGVNFLPTSTTGSFIGSTTINGSTSVTLTAHVTSPTKYNVVLASGRSMWVGGDGWC